MKRFLVIGILSLMLAAPLAAQDQPVAQAVVFWMEGCPHCQEVVDKVLPSLTHRFGVQLDVRLVEVKTVEEVDRLYQLGDNLGVDKDWVQVPLLVIDHQTLVGDEISDHAAEIIEQVLAAGGAEWPDLPGWSIQVTPEPTEKVCHLCAEDVAVPSSSTTPAPVVHFWLFWDSHCGDCLVMMDEILPAILNGYAEGQVVVHSRDLEKGNYEMMRALELKHGLEYGAMPEIFIGDQVLLGNDEIQARLPSLIDHYLAQGGARVPEVPPLNTPTSPPELEFEGPAVHLAYFESLDCQACDLIQFSLDSLQAQHAQLVIHEYSVINDAALLARLCGQAGISVSGCIAPAVFVGREGLAGEALGANSLTDLIARHLARGAAANWDEPVDKDAAALRVLELGPWCWAPVAFLLLLLLGLGWRMFGNKRRGES